MKKNFDFSLFRNLQGEKANHISDEFLEWFVGFFEGDGSLIVNHRKDLQIVISQDTHDIQVLHYVAKTLGFGTVMKQGETVSRYSVAN